MKPVLSLIAIFLVMPFIAFSQKKMMKMDAELVANSKPMEAKPKGISTVPKYEFGPYKIVSGRAGWTTSKSRSRMFTGITTSKSESKFSFIQASSQDTARVNAIVTTETRIQDLNRVGLRFGNADWGQELQNNTQQYLATIDLSSDTTSWDLVIIEAMGTEVRGSRFRGVLSSSTQIFDIQPVVRMDNGKVNPFVPILGYDFLLDGKGVAAVQASENMFLKNYVWIDERLDSRTQQILAAAAATLLVRNMHRLHD